MRTEEWRELADRVPQRAVTLDRSREAKGWIALKAAPCPFYDYGERACTVYDVRPYNCRRFMCGRWDVTKEPFIDSRTAMLTKIAADNDLRWSFRRMMTAAIAWAVAHGWTADQVTR